MLGHTILSVALTSLVLCRAAPTEDLDKRLVITDTTEKIGFDEVLNVAGYKPIGVYHDIKFTNFVYGTQNNGLDKPLSYISYPNVAAFGDSLINSSANAVMSTFYDARHTIVNFGVNSFYTGCVRRTSTSSTSYQVVSPCNYVLTGLTSNNAQFGPYVVQVSATKTLQKVTVNTPKLVRLTWTAPKGVIVLIDGLDKDVVASYNN